MASFFFVDMLANVGGTSPRGGGHHSTGGAGSPMEHEESSPQHQRGFAYELPRPRQSPSVSPRTTEMPLTLAPPPKRLKYDPTHAAPSDTSPVHGGGHALPSWRHHHYQHHQHQHQPSEATGPGSLSLPRLQDESRWRSDPYPSGLHSPNDTLAQRPQPPPQLPRFPDARV